VPLKAGPTKNIYLFTKLRDQYKNKFVQTAHLIGSLEDEVRRKNNLAAE